MTRLLLGFSLLAVLVYLCLFLVIYWAVGEAFGYVLSRCPMRDTCPYAYDPYNIDGECLAEK